MSGPVTSTSTAPAAFSLASAASNTASVFGEQLTFREMVAREKNEKIRKRLIAGKVEDMLAKGDAITAKVIKIDSEPRKVALSVKEYLLDQGRAVPAPVAAAAEESEVSDEEEPSAKRKKAKKK